MVRAVRCNRVSAGSEDNSDHLLSDEKRRGESCTMIRSIQLLRCWFDQNNPLQSNATPVIPHPPSLSFDVVLTEESRNEHSTQPRLPLDDGRAWRQDSARAYPSLISRISSSLRSWWDNQHPSLRLALSFCPCRSLPNTCWNSEKCALFDSVRHRPKARHLTTPA